jgi:hypothetical protein
MERISCSILYKPHFISLDILSAFYSYQYYLNRVAIFQPQSPAQLDRRYDLDQVRWIAAPLRPDHGCLDAVQFDAIAFALAKALAPLLEALNPDRLLLCREGLIQQHVQGAWEGDKAQMLQELAAVALTGDEVLALSQTRCNFSAHEFDLTALEMYQSSSIGTFFPRSSSVSI